MLALAHFAVDNFLALWVVRVIIESVGEFSFAAWIEVETEAEVLRLVLGLVVVCVRESNHSEYLVASVRARGTNMNMTWRRLIDYTEKCIYFRNGALLDSQEALFEFSLNHLLRKEILLAVL